MKKNKYGHAEYLGIYFIASKKTMELSKVHGLERNMQKGKLNFTHIDSRLR